MASSHNHRVILDEPLYNSRLLNNYIEFLKKFYPEIDLDSILTSSGITAYQIKDEGHWFSQRHIDLFHEALSDRAIDPDISWKVGRYAAISKASGALREYALGFMSPSSIYWLAEKISAKVTRAIVLRSKKLGANKVEVLAIPKPGVAENPNQCRNRQGMFEAASMLFTGKFAEIEHPNCMHQGGEICRYIIRWQVTPAFTWKRVRNYSAVFCVLVSLASFFALTIPEWMFLSLCLLVFNMAISLYAERVQKNELVKTVEAQGESAKDHLDALNIRYNNALLVQEIGQATSVILDQQELVNTVAKVMEKRLDFDRGLIMLATRSKDRLVYRAGFGQSPEAEEKLRRAEFNLNNPGSQGVFVRAFREQKPFLLSDVEKESDKFSQRSYELVRKIGVQSLICVPVVYERETLGILAVDNIKSKRPLTQSDVNLLLGVASQTAVSIVNAMSFKKIQESEKKYRDLVENANSIIMRIDIKGNIVFFNEFAQKFFSYNEADVLHKNVVGTILPQTQGDSRTFQGLISDLLRDTERPVVTETEHVLRTGQRVWVSWTYKLISESEKDFKEVLCIGNNITELKRAQEERRELEARLQRSQKMEALGTLAGGVAHDLNNILSGLVGYPELLLMDLPEESRFRKPILTIQKSGEKAAQIVQDLLTLARRGVAVTEVVNLNQIVDDYLKSPEFMRLMEHHPAVKLNAQMNPDLLNVIGSPVHLSKTVMNLVSNAAEAMPAGGTITVRTVNQYVERFIHGYDSIERGDYVVLTVSDTGIGISPADRERIFEPFYSKKVMGRSGTGLGMAVVWGTVKDHKGYIDLQSDEGKGTTFTIYLPVTRQGMAEKRGPVSIEDLKGKGESIVVVDDVMDQREIATEMLEKLGYQVVAMKSGEDAVEYLRDQSADLLILDMIMDPGIDGLETYRRVLEIRPGQKAIITSGFSESERVMEAKRLGVGDYVKKPYLIEKLGLAVKRELKR